MLADYVGPVTVVRGSHGVHERMLAASITARYGDIPDRAVPVRVKIQGKGSVPYVVEVTAAGEADYAPIRVAGGVTAPRA